MGIVPTLNSSGQFTVQSPFKLVDGVSYTCIANRKFKDLLNQQVAVWDRYYSPYGLTQEQYNQDLKDEAVLVTLFSDDAPTVYIPSTYILSYPDASATTFRHRVLSCSLGAIPDSLALDDFLQKVRALASDVVGIEPTVALHSVTLSTVVTKEVAEAFEAARQARINNRTTEHAQLLASQEENAILRQRNQMLEELLVQKS